MNLSDLVTIGLVCVALWTFIPRHIRRALRLGLEPTVVVVADSVRSGTRVGWKLFTRLAYKVLIGRDIDAPVIVNSMESDDEKEDIALPATKQQNNNNVIATPATDSNALLLQNTARNLAIAVKAGKMTETEGIKLFFGVSPSSSNPRYLAARAALKAELEKLDPPKYRGLSSEQEALRQQLHAK